jgi:hypothetical protein
VWLRTDWRPMTKTHALSYTLPDAWDTAIDGVVGAARLAACRLILSTRKRLCVRENSVSECM